MKRYIRFDLYRLCLLTLSLSIVQIVVAQSNIYTTNLFSSDNQDGTYTNPLIHADYPDPDIIRVGTDYYMVSSSFTCMPGVPICHSKDLVNWRIIGHAYDSLTTQPEYSMTNNQVAYRGGTWAPSIRYHKGKWYICFCSPKDGFFMCIANKPEGPYTMTSFGGLQLYDPGLFFDDDDRVYVVHGACTIYITELTADAKAVKKPMEVLYESSYGQPLEGSHVYKRNGYYYIFNTSHGYNGIEVVYRSKHIYGPYESKLICEDALNYPDAGMHQGGYVDLPNGDSWFFMFQDRDYLGRDPVLQPLQWVNDWPIMGDPANNYNKVVTYKKPTISGHFPIAYPQSSDEFNQPKLSPWWEFNHNPDAAKWSLTEKSGMLRLHSSYATDFWHARNTLTQKIAGPASIGSASINTTHLKEGDFAGIGIFGYPYGHVGVLQKKDSQYIVMLNMDTVIESIPFKAGTLYVQTKVDERGMASFAYSTDNTTFRTIGNEVELKFTVKTFLGNRFALCCYQTLANKPGGYVDIDWFHLSGNTRGNHYAANKPILAIHYDVSSGIQPVRILSKRPMGYITNSDTAGWTGYNNIHFGNDIKKPLQSIAVNVRRNETSTILELVLDSLSGKKIGSFILPKYIATQRQIDTTYRFPIKSVIIGTHKVFIQLRSKQPNAIAFTSFQFSSH